MDPIDTVASSNPSLACRRVQRLLARWLDADATAARRLAFDVRTTLVALDTAERTYITRWLAWLCVATRSQGRRDFDTRLARLDATLGAGVRVQLGELTSGHPGPPDLRQSA